MSPIRSLVPLPGPRPARRPTRLSSWGPFVITATALIIAVTSRLRELTAQIALGASRACFSPPRPAPGRATSAPRDDWIQRGEPTIAGARGALIEAQVMGLKVPQDVSITGFADHELAAQFSPGLTTVRIPHQEMSACIGDYLLDRLRGEPVQHATKIEARIMWRESTGPAPTRRRYPEVRPARAARGGSRT